MRRYTFSSPGGGVLAIIATKRVQLELGGWPWDQGSKRSAELLCGPG